MGVIPITFFRPKIVVEGAGNGYLYNWLAASNANFAPTDWKVPLYSELQALVTELGGSSVAGGKMKEVGLVHWNAPNTGADNSSGFTAYGAGVRTASGPFSSLLEVTIIQASDASFDSRLRYITMTNGGASCLPVSGGQELFFGSSIRLLYTGGGSPSTVTDNDGNVYDTVLIGTQRWTIQNWKSTTLDNGTPIPNVTNDATWSTLNTLARCAYNNDESNV